MEEVQNWKYDYDQMSPKQRRDELAKLKAYKVELKDEVDFNNAMQLALKLVLNGTYGAFANKWFALFNKNIAAAITAMGREVTKHMVKRVEHYFYNMWHNDTELHEKMGLTEVKQIPPDYIDNRTGENVSLDDYEEFSLDQKQEEWNKTLRYQRRYPCTVYGDTDSCVGSTVIRTNYGDMPIQDLFDGVNSGDMAEVLHNEQSTSGHEILHVNGLSALNWTDESGVHQSPVRKVVRHRVSKARYKITTASGRSIQVTGDHSMVVFRDGTQAVVRACDVLPSDKVLTVV